jgi:hypothetical protein
VYNLTYADGDTVERWAWQGITDVNKDTALLSQSKNIKKECGAI